MRGLRNISTQCILCSIKTNIEELDQIIYSLGMQLMERLDLTRPSQSKKSSDLLLNIKTNFLPAFCSTKTSILCSRREFQCQN